MLKIDELDCQPDENRGFLRCNSFIKTYPLLAELMKLEFSWGVREGEIGERGCGRGSLVHQKSSKSSSCMGLKFELLAELMKSESSWSVTCLPNVSQKCRFFLEFKALNED